MSLPNICLMDGLDTKPTPLAKIFSGPSYGPGIKSAAFTVRDVDGGGIGFILGTHVDDEELPHIPSAADPGVLAATCML